MTASGEMAAVGVGLGEGVTAAGVGDGTGDGDAGAVVTNQRRAPPAATPRTSDALLMPAFAP